MFDEGRVAPHARDCREPHEYLIIKESQPYAFAFSVFADDIHAVVPIPRTDEGQPVYTVAFAPQYRTHAMVVQIRGFFSLSGKIVI
jgi:hypothetical protein